MEQDNRYCEKCGTLLHGETCPNCNEAAQTQQSSAGADVTAIERALVDSNYDDYYAIKFNNIRVTGSNGSWNFAAFFLGLWWCLYRKMYGVGVIAWLVGIAGSFFCGWLSLAAVIYMGIMGNYHYMQHIENRTLEARSIKDEQERATFIERKGGVNIALVVALIILQVVLTLFVNIYSYSFNA